MLRVTILFRYLVVSFVVILSSLQITEDSVRLIDCSEQKLVADWKEPNGGSISLAAANSLQILVATAGGKLHLLEVVSNTLAVIRYFTHATHTHTYTHTHTHTHTHTQTHTQTQYVDFKSPGGLRASSEAAKQLGYQGKFAIHPNQVEAVNACFSPSQEEIEYAKRVVELYEKAEKEGKGTTSIDGKMIDAPVAKRAYALLRRSRPS